MHTQIGSARRLVISFEINWCLRYVNARVLISTSAIIDLPVSLMQLRANTQAYKVTFPCERENSVLFLIAFPMQSRVPKKSNEYNEVISNLLI